MEIIKLPGEDQQLYYLTAHLVMNEEVVAYNLNYPFKTSPAYHWFIALENGVTIGFIPLKFDGMKAVINNYYVVDDDSTVFKALLENILSETSKNIEIEAITQTKHIKHFEQNGFYAVAFWKRFVKMRSVEHGAKCV
ncbi:MAG: hypothetical protein LBR65_00515 [Culturomica sp.]|jgi:hypothetical protein|nr:hypothetical protein [Culturomica sp.]